MIGLGCSTASRDPIRPCFNGTLPYNGSYIYLEEVFKFSGDGPAQPVSIHDYDNISFDDSTMEAFDYEGDSNIYSEITGSPGGGTNKYVAGSVFLIPTGSTVTISGHITRLNNGQVWNNDDTSINGFVKFSTSAEDTFRVYIDFANTSTITASNIDRVSSNGSFQVEKTIANENGVKWFNITSSNIEYQGGHRAADEPRVRISNLIMTVS